MANKVLIIDDDAEFVEAITNLLDAKGYSLEHASNGKDGLEKAKNISPDIILLDVMMATKQEGIDVANEIHNDKTLNQIPVVMITGIRKEMNLPFGLEADNDYMPVREVLEKPVKPELLLKVISENIKK